MDYASQQRNPAKHVLGIVVVIAMHVLLVWALQNGLAHKVMSLVKKPIDAKLIEEVKPKEPDLPPPPPPPPPPKKPPPPPDYVPPPEITPAVAAPAAGPVIAAVTQAPPPPKVEVPLPPPPPAPPPPPLAPKPMLRVAPVVSASSCEKPEYPASSRRQEEEGTVVLRFLVAEDGRVIDSKVEKTSGYARLDEAARAALSKCKFKPGTVDGAPEQAWAAMKYTWRLE